MFVAMKRRAWVSALGAVMGLCGACGDDSGTDGAEIYSSRVAFQQAQIISAYPAKKQEDGSWVRVCQSGPADGIITNIALLSSLRHSSASGTASDQDVSIRPNDVIETRVVDGGLPDDIDLSSAGNIDFQLDCINPGSTTGNDCQGAQGAASAADEVRYVPNTTSRKDGHNVLLLIDQSGSVGGLVRDGIYKEEQIPNPLPQDFGEVASDRMGLRLATARRLGGILNKGDRFGAIAFGEAINLWVPCAEATGNFDEDLEACFGTYNNDSWSAGIDNLYQMTGGRSNLWQAVKTAYEFLRAKGDTQRSNHVIVLTDGPDTCAGEDRLTCTTPCTTADYDALANELTSDAADPNGVPIHIHFVQFESLGYPGRDPRQIEVSCLTGGHYQYVNSNVFSREQAGPFQDALDTAVANVRYALMGHWQIATAVLVYGDDGGLPPGQLYALQGAVTLRASSNLVTVDKTFPFGFGQGQGATDATNWDRRPTIRKPCGAAEDCGGASDPGACSVVCSPETHVCANGSSAVPLPDLASCDAGGGFGSCCGGQCQDSGECSACNGR